MQLRRGGPQLVDYGGNAPLAAEPQWWSVVAGNSIALAEWPLLTEDVFAGDEPLPDDVDPVWKAYVEAKRDAD